MRNDLAEKYELARIQRILILLQRYFDASIYSRDCPEQVVNEKGRDASLRELEKLLGVTGITSKGINLVLNEILQSYVGYCQELLIPVPFEYNPYD